MRLLRGVGGAGLWIVASLLGLVGVILCVTVILLPVGIPLLKTTGRLFRHAVQLMLPRALAHPVNELGRAAKKQDRQMTHAMDDTTKRARKTAQKMRKRIA